MTTLAPDLPTVETFGPRLINFDTIEDPQTDLDADNLNAMKAQLAAISQVAPKAVVVFDAALNVLESRSVWGSGSGLAPIVTNPGSGVYVITWATSYPDMAYPEDQVSRDVAIRGVTVSATATSGRLFSYERTSDNVITLRCFSDAGGATNVDGEVTLVAW